MRKTLLATASVLALSIGAATADDEARVIEEDAATEAAIDVTDADTMAIDNPFGYGNYDAQEILDASLVGLEGQNLADPIDLLIDSDENIAFIVTYVSGRLVVIDTEQLTADREDGELVLRTDSTRADLATMGNFDASDFDYRLYSEHVYGMSGVGDSDAETTDN